jgi:hypothetical protein
MSGTSTLSGYNTFETEMKLAEALAERSDSQSRIEELKKRLTRSARVQEGESPAEDPATLLAELDGLIDRLLELVGAINRTNSRTEFGELRTVSDAIAERDVADPKPRNGASGK